MLLIVLPVHISYGNGVVSLARWTGYDSMYCCSVPVSIVLITILGVKYFIREGVNVENYAHVALLLYFITFFLYGYLIESKEIIKLSVLVLYSVASYYVIKKMLSKKYGSNLYMRKIMSAAYKVVALFSLVGALMHAFGHHNNGLFGIYVYYDYLGVVVVLLYAANSLIKDRLSVLGMIYVFWFVVHTQNNLALVLLVLFVVYAAVISSVKMEALNSKSGILVISAAVIALYFIVMGLVSLDFSYSLMLRQNVFQLVLESSNVFGLYLSSDEVFRAGSLHSQVLYLIAYSGFIGGALYYYFIIKAVSASVKLRLFLIPAIIISGFIVNINLNLYVGGGGG